MRGKTHIDKVWGRISWAKGVLCGGGAARIAAVSERANDENNEDIEAPEEQAKREEREKRLHTTTCFVIVMGMVEGSSSTMTSALFLLVPLNPRVIGGEPIPWHYVLQVWVIQVRDIDQHGHV